MVGSFYVTVDGHDAYGTLSAGEKDVASVRQRPGEAGEVRLVYAPKAPHTASDGSGSYNSGRYNWGSLTSPVYETSIQFDALVPSWNAKTPAGT